MPRTRQLPMMILSLTTFLATTFLATTFLATTFLSSMVLAAAPVVEPTGNSAAEDSIQVTVVGTLRTGIFAIGGETTGTTVTAKGITWELDLGKVDVLGKAAEKLHGKRALVQGSLERRKGVEIKERWIVTVTGLQAVVDGRVAGSGKPGYHATFGRTDSCIRFASENGKTIFNITSDFGIDKATIERPGDNWPMTIVVRLHLKGLESFEVGDEKLAVEWSVASTGENVSRVSLRQGKDELLLNDKSSYHTIARIVGGNGRIPLKDGYFEVPLPAKLFEKNPKEISLRWIDFYRN